MKVNGYFLLLLISLVSLGCKSNKKKQITIATAANMQFAMKEIAKVFESKTGISCQLVISSSGKLTTQIQEGAPYDVFVSANLAYPEALFQSGLATEPPKVYALGQLVLWSADIALTKGGLEALSMPQIKHIAIAHPRTAPYGAAAIEVLKHKEVWNQIEDKLVYGESISQVNQFLISKSAQIGFTSRSVVLSSPMQATGNWYPIPISDHQPIRQSVILIKNKGEKYISAKRFYDFLFSKDAVDILKEFGYLESEIQ